MSEQDKNDPETQDTRDGNMEQEESRQTRRQHETTPERADDEELVVGGSSAEPPLEGNRSLLYGLLGGGILVVAILIGLFFLPGGDDDGEQAEPGRDAVTAPGVTGGEQERRALTLQPPKEVEEWSPADFQLPPSQEVRDIQQALQQGDSLMASGNLIQPEGNNALAAYLSVLEKDPDNAVAQAGIDQIAERLVEQANQALAEGRISDALEMESAVETIRPQAPGLAELQQAFEAQGGVIDQLTAAAEDLNEGRLIAPEGDNALAKYRQVLELNPNIADAQQGIENVELALLEQATNAAQELDFEAASEILASAEGVREGPGAVEETRQNIQQFREDSFAQAVSDAEAAIAEREFTRAEESIARAAQIQPDNERIAQLEQALNEARATPGQAEMEAFAGLAADARAAIEAEDYAGAEALIDQAAELIPDDERLTELRQELTRARVYAQYEPGDTFQDPFADGAGTGPTMVVMPVGSFLMGSTDEEQGHRSYEGPVHEVNFTDAFAVSQTEVTVGQFRQFVEATGYVTDAERDGATSIYSEDTGRMEEDENIYWVHDFRGERADEDMPVIHVSWNDARAYARWLAQATGEPYRLLSEAEFEYAVRGGTRTPYWWGNGPPAREVENLTGEDDLSEAGRSWTNYFADYGDGYWGPAPVAEFATNPFGLYDMGGNVSEWVMDCWHDSYARAPGDGSAWVNAGCDRRVVRGAAWGSPPDRARSAYRISGSPDTHTTQVGFRVARDL